MLDETTTGQVLRRLRELSGMSDRAAARRLGVSRSELRDWEAHRAEPDADQLTRAVEVYGHDVESALAIRTPLTQPGRPGVLLIGDEEVVVADHLRLAATSHAANQAVLTSYLAAVRRQRGLEPDSPVQLRAHDIGSLAIELDLTDDHLQALLAELLDLTPAGAQYTTRALLVGALVAVMATGLVQNSWFVPNASASPARDDTPPAQVVEAHTALFDAGDLGPTERGPAFSPDTDAVPPGWAAEISPVDRVLSQLPAEDAAALRDRVPPPMPYAEVTPDELPFSIFSVDPVERRADREPPPAEGPDPVRAEGRSGVFSVTPRGASQADGPSADDSSGTGAAAIPALGPGSPALPPAD